MTLMSAVYVAALGFNTALYYGGYILLSGLYLFHTDGYAFQYFWPGFPEWNKVAVAPIGLALVASGSLFARSYLDAPRFHPALNRVLIGAAAASTALLVLSFWLLHFEWFKTVALLFAALCAVLQTGRRRPGRSQAAGRCVALSWRGRRGDLGCSFWHLRLSQSRPIQSGYRRSRRPLCTPGRGCRLRARGVRTHPDPAPRS